METLLNFVAPQKPQGFQKNMLVAAIREEMNRAIRILNEQLNECVKGSSEWEEISNKIAKIKTAADQLGNLSIDDLKHLQNSYQLPMTGNNHESIERN